MLKTRIIPCMLYNGLNLVKTIKFEQMRNLGNPVQFAKVYNARDVDALIFIDLMASSEKRVPEFEMIANVINECFMPVTIGGGIKTLEHADKLLKAGADKIVINSAIIENPKFLTKLAKKFGSQFVVAAIDAKRIDDNYIVFSERGKKNTEISVRDWINKVEDLGAGEIFLTSIDQDGTMEGYDLELIKLVTSNTGLPVIACGGAGKVQDIVDAVLMGKSDAVSLASMFHYSGHTANSIKERMDKAGIPVRLMTS